MTGAAAGLAALWLIPAAALAADPVPVPSGREVTLIEVIGTAPGPEGLAIRFRFLAPAIAAPGGLDTAAADMLHLCEAYALPRIPAIGPRPGQVIISMSDRPAAFGDPDPAIVQVFDAFRPEGGQCIPEVF